MAKKKDKKKKNKMSLGKKWGLATLAVLLLGYFDLIFIRQLSIWWLLLFYFVYLCFVLFMFRKNLYGELGFYIYASGKTEQGHRMCKNACQKGTRSIQALNLCGLELLREGHPDEAAEHFIKGIEVNKRRNLLYDKYLVANLASCYWLKGEIDRAIDCLRDLEYRYGYLNPDVNTTLGYLYLVKEDYEKALSYSQAALQANPEHGSAMDNIGQIYFRQENYEKATEFFLKALEYKPTLADSKYYLGLVYERQNDLINAKKYYEDAYNSNVTSLNTITREQIDAKYKEFFTEVT